MIDIMTAQKAYMGHNWKRRLSVLAVAAVLGGGLGAASTSNAFAADNEISSSINITQGSPTVQPPPDTNVGRSLGLEVDGTVIKGITEVSGLKMDQDVIELKQNTASGKYVIKKLPGRPKSGEVTLTRSLTADNSFQKWAKDVRLGKMNNARKNCMVIVYDSAGQPIKRYKLTNAWPKSLEIGSLKAADASVLTEKLILTYEQMDVE
jgi:phage tail-like protein